MNFMFKHNFVITDSSLSRQQFGIVQNDKKGPFVQTLICKCLVVTLFLSGIIIFTNKVTASYSKQDIILDRQHEILQDSIYLSIPDTVVLQGSTVQIPIYVSNLTDFIFGYQFDLCFDSTVIRFTDYDTDHTISQNATLEKNIINGGHIRIGAFSASAFVDSGALLLLRLKVVGSKDDSTEIRLLNAIFGNATTPVCTHSGRLFVTELMTQIAEFSTNTLPKEFKLMGGFPNPFNQYTSILCKLLQTDNVTVEVFNVLGCRVRTIFHGMLQPGDHRFIWNGNNDQHIPMSSGVYFIRVTSSQSQHLIKVLRVNYD